MNVILGNFLLSSEVFSIFEFLIPRPFCGGVVYFLRGRIMRGSLKRRGIYVVGT